MLSVLLTVVLLCGQVAVVDSACSCVGCTDRESVPAYSTESWSATGTHVEVSVRSTDGSALKVRTCSKADCSRIWGDASADGTVTCFNSGPVRVSTTPTYIRVEVECENWIQSCPIQYDIRILAVPAPAPVSAPAPTQGVQVCSSGCSFGWIGDGECDHVCNNPRCAYDGGDCRQEEIDVTSPPVSMTNGCPSRLSCDAAKATCDAANIGFFTCSVTNGVGSYTCGTCQGTVGSASIGVPISSAAVGPNSTSIGATLQPGSLLIMMASLAAFGGLWRSAV